MIEVQWSLSHPELLVGVVEAHGVQIAGSSEALLDTIAQAVARVQSEAAWPPPAIQAAMRDMLRLHGYKPTGRGKPASEYLAEAARKGAFPAINNVVDINNLVSLRSGWPISMLDAARALGDASALEIRVGAPDERYAFNTAGHEIELKGLLGVARVGGALVGNPVKDSMAAKTNDTTTSLVVFLYTSRRVATAQTVRAEAEALGELLRQHAGEAAVSVRGLSALGDF